MRNHKLFQLTSAAALAAGALIIVACVLAALPQAQPVRSAPAAPAAGGVITVTTTIDQFGTGAGECSLREAIESINTNTSFGGCTNPGSAADTVFLPAGTHTIAITETTPIYPVDNSDGPLVPMTMTIRGLGPDQTIISAAPAWNGELLYVYQTSVNLEGLTFTGGTQGAIYLNRPSFLPPTSLTNAIIEGNTGGPAIRLISGGYPDTLATSALVLTDVIIRNNSSGPHGGGALRAADGGHIIVAYSALYDNSTINHGGSIYFQDRYGGDSSLQLTNVTIYSNTAALNGGGIWIEGVATTTVEIRNVTLVGNMAGGSYNGGNLYNAGSGISLINTIVASGTVGGAPNNCAGNPGPNITSLGHNLEDADTCGLNASSDYTETNPLLQPIADNGGRTPTMALLEGSLAINHGDCSAGPTTDQRGFPRLVPCDTGAYEYVLWVYLPLVMRN